LLRSNIKIAEQISQNEKAAKSGFFYWEKLAKQDSPTDTTSLGC
jgi:hypothetical protein